MSDGSTAIRAGVHRESSASDSLGLVTAMETYKERLPRRRKKASDGCWGLTCYSWLFLLLALLQVAMVTGIQIAIALLGRFRGGDRLENYFNCFESSLDATLNERGIQLNISILEIPGARNFTYPSFGRDKEIYVYFFIAVVVYNFSLCFYALKLQNIVEVYMFMIINVMAMGYACLQVYQFRGFGSMCEPVTTVGYLALANVLVLLTFTFIFAFLSLFIYVEFGWKTYVLVDCNPGMRYYYRVHQVFMSIVKLFLLFLVIFSVSQVSLILPIENYEFSLTILIGLAAIAAFPFIYLIVTFEFLPGAITLLLLGLAFIAYYIFKIVRYVRQSCPVCRDRVNAIENETGFIREELIRRQIDNATIISVVDQFKRAQEFQNLTLFGVVSLLITIVTIVAFIHYWRQFGKGLKNYFARKHWHQWVNKNICCWYNKCTRDSGTDSSKDGVDVDVEASAGRSLNLVKENGRKKTKKRSNDTSDSVRDDSTRLHQTTYSPVQPNFGLAAPIN